MAVTVEPIAGLVGGPVGPLIAQFDTAGLKGSIFTAAIAWGDNSPDVFVTPVPDASQPGLYDVDAAHVYDTAGPHVVQVSVADTSGDLVSGVGVASIAPVIVPVGLVVSATAGTPLSNVTVGSFGLFGTTAPAGGFQATINWGDGATTAGTVKLNTTTMLYDVVGSHTYGAAGTDTITVTLLPSAMTPGAQITSKAVVAAAAATTPTITPVGQVVPATAGVPLSNVTVGSFAYSGTPPPGGFQAIIAWGDGTTTAGTVTFDASTMLYNVVGSHTYKTGGTEPITVAILASATTPAASIASTAIVTPTVTVIPFTGGLNYLSDTGSSDTDGITADNQPTFSGTGAPYSIVRLFAQGAFDAAPVMLGQTPIVPNGQWQLTAPPLADGTYQMTAVVIDPNGAVEPTQPLTGDFSQITIDTASPQVVGVSYNPRAEQITIAFRDTLSGMDPATLLNPANYTLIFGPLSRRDAAAVALKPWVPSVVASDPQGVLLSLGLNPRQLRALKALRIVSGGITDVAGNELVGNSVWSLVAARPRRVVKR
jgi:hypothetical protein